MLVFIINTLCLFFASTLEASSLFRKGSVFCEKRSCHFKEDVLDFNTATAVGTFNDTLLVSGWGILDVKAGHATRGPMQADADIMFASGFIEGVFTARQTANHFTNMFRTFFPEPVDIELKKKLSDWFIKQRSWAEEQIKSNQNDPFWRQASYVFAHIDGLYAGFQSVGGGVEETLDMFAIYYLNANGDLLDLLAVLKGTWTDEFGESAFSSKDEDLLENRCSALIKILPGYENILMSHATWFVYANTNRIYKHYNFNINDPATNTKKMSFSSYPGILSSLDDFFILGSGMVMLQTSLNVYNKSLYKLVKPESLLAWQRVRIANAMAKSGNEWAQAFARYNSGTYNNQYLVLDLKLVRLKEALPNNTLWMVEQIPGTVVADDVTNVLQYGYFPAYNVPYFKEIFAKSGYEPGAYQLAVRANIFRRDQSKVKDLETLGQVMRSNDYKHDPYSKGSPVGAICARGDLEGFADGCYDAKLSDYGMAKNFEADIISGPTLGTNLPPFVWKDSFNASHVGLPNEYNFPFIRAKPRFD